MASAMIVGWKTSHPEPSGRLSDGKTAEFSPNELLRRDAARALSPIARKSGRKNRTIFPFFGIRFFGVWCRLFVFVCVFFSLFWMFLCSRTPAGSQRLIESILAPVATIYFYGFKMRSYFLKRTVKFSHWLKSFSKINLIWAFNIYL